MASALSRTVASLPTRLALCAFRGAALLGAALLAACSDGIEQASCPSDSAAITQPIVNGAQHEQFLGLGDADTAAIVAIDNGPWPTGSLCTGVMVRPNWVLTALHCLAIENPRVHIHQTPELVTSATVVQAITHPTLDVSLLEIEPLAVTGDASTVRPLAVTADSAGIDWVGQRVEVAGYGLTESSAPNGLNFAVESVVEMTDVKLRIDGQGRSGACEGDSGGPLLVRGRDGRPLVLGILSGGEASCVGRDSFIRTDALGDWLASILPPEDEQAIPCGQITAAGKCAFGSALRCVDERLQADACDTDEVCGWDPTAGSFGCVAAAVDPCQGAGSSGICDGTLAITCAAGHRASSECAICGTCRYAPSNGSPQCGAAAR